MRPLLAPFVTPTLAERPGELDYITTTLARYPNLAIKWCHATARLSAEPYPHRDTVLWASDFTESRPHTWAQSLHYLLYSEQLSASEKAWVLGRSARAVLGWPRG